MHYVSFETATGKTRTIVADSIRLRAPLLDLGDGCVIVEWSNTFDLPFGVQGESAIAFGAVKVEPFVTAF